MAGIVVSLWDSSAMQAIPVALKSEVFECKIQRAPEIVPRLPLNPIRPSALRTIATSKSGT